MAVQIYEEPTGSDSQRVHALLRAIFGLHANFKDELWLWRGQASDAYLLEPGMHTRLRNGGQLALTEDNVGWATQQLIVDVSRRSSGPGWLRELV